MKLYQQIRNRIESEFINARKLSPGERFPPYSFFQKRYQVSFETVMRAVNEMENSGLIIRESPRKLFVACSRASENAGVGLIGFNGDIFGDYEVSLRHNLYERNIFASSVFPPMNKKDVDRFYERFFQNKYSTLLVMDAVVFDPVKIERYKEMFGQLLFPFTASLERWSIPCHGVFIDTEFAIYESLKLLYTKGHRRVAIFTPGPPDNLFAPGKPRGIKRFLSEFNIPESDKEFAIDIYNSHELNRNTKSAMEWARTFPSETDAIVGSSDFSVVKAQEWLNEYSKLDYQNITYIGRGNTNWSSCGPCKFASFDFRVDDVVKSSLDIISERSNEPVIRMLKPKLKREGLIADRS